MALADQTYGDYNWIGGGVYHVNSPPLHIPQLDNLTTQIGACMTKLDRIASRPPFEDVNSVGRGFMAPTCNYCGSSMHISYDCPSRYEDVSAMYQGRPNQQQRWDSRTTTYNENRRPNSTFGWRNQENSHSSYQIQPYEASYEQMVPIQESKTDETNQLLKNLVGQFSQFSRDMKDHREVTDSRFSALEKRIEQWEANHDNINTHITQLSNSLNDMNAETDGSIPSNTVTNPRSLNAIELRSGKKVHFPDEDDDEVDEEIEVEKPPLSPMQLVDSESSEEKAIIEKNKGEDIEQPQVEQQPLLNEVDPKKKNIFEKGETSKQDVLSNANGYKLMEEAEFEVGSQDLDDSPSKGVTLTPTETYLHKTHPEPQNNEVKGPFSTPSLNHSIPRPKITPHTLKFLNELITPYDVGMKDTTSPKFVTSIDQSKVDSTLGETNAQVVDSKEPNTCYAPPKFPRLKAYESSKFYKEKIKMLHDKKIVRKKFKIGDRVLLYRPRVKLKNGKLKDKWYGPFTVTKVHSFGMVELLDETNGKEFQVNRHLLKLFRHLSSKPP